MKRLAVVLFALLVLPGTGVLGCATSAGPSDYDMLADLCRAQCPTAHVLALRACNEIDEDSPWRQVCVDQADRALELCPGLCERIREKGSEDESSEAESDEGASESESEPVDEVEGTFEL